MKVLLKDTTSYPHLVLTGYSRTDNEDIIGRYELTPAENYVIHNHENCDIGDAEMGIEAKCYYHKLIGLPPTTDLSTINHRFKALLKNGLN